MNFWILGVYFSKKAKELDMRKAHFRWLASWSPVSRPRPSPPRRIKKLVVTPLTAQVYNGWQCLIFETGDTSFGATREEAIERAMAQARAQLQAGWRTKLAGLLQYLQPNQPIAYYEDIPDENVARFGDQVVLAL